MIKMIVTDIDGTLLPEATPVPPEDVTETLRSLLDLGVRVVLASGRPYSSLRTLFPSLLDRLTFLCSNGSVVMQGDRLLYAELLGTEEEINEILTFARQSKQPWHIDSWAKSYTEVHDAEYLGLIRTVGVEIDEVENVEELGVPITKMSLGYSDGPDAHYNDPDMLHYRKIFSVAPAGMVFMDFNRKDALRRHDSGDLFPVPFHCCQSHPVHPPPSG